MSAADEDPRLDPARISDDLIVDDLMARPSVGRPGRGLPMALIIGVFVLAGVGLFAWLSANRTARQSATTTESASTATFGGASAPAPLELPASADRESGPLFNIPAPQFNVSNALAPLTMAPPSPGPPAQASAALDLRDPLARRRAPALVVDFGGPSEAALVIPNPALVPASAVKPGEGAATEAAALSAEERFADRVAQGDVDQARATTLRNLDTLVPQGAVIPAVLETAINSDLPGFTRAVVSRDVMNFDGKTVLIPRGSRLIGQYKSGVAMGASRVFVIWTRVIRPDGVSVQIGSPGTDALGRGGMGGDVDRRFFQRFGGSILLSVLNVGLQGLVNAGRDGDQIFIGSPAAASNVASEALSKDGGIPPTIKTPQGAPVRIFVARDLDFSGVAKLK
jgi:type IV secretory pathway VirB10-like protein